jgi:hypothetical protein
MIKMQTPWIFNVAFRTFTINFDLMSVLCYTGNQMSSCNNKNVMDKAGAFC